MEKLDPFGLSKISIFGSPHHRLLSAGSLVEPPPEDEGGCEHKPITTGNTYLLRIPDFPEVERTPEQLEKDMEDEHEWRNAGTFNERCLYGATLPPIDQQTIGSPVAINFPCIAVDGSIWKVGVTPSFTGPSIGFGIASGDDTVFQIDFAAERDLAIQDIQPSPRVIYRQSITHTESGTLGALTIRIFDINSRGDELLIGVPILITRADSTLAGLSPILSYKFCKINLTINPEPEDDEDNLSVTFSVLHSAENSLGNLEFDQSDTMVLKNILRIGSTGTTTPISETCQRIEFDEIIYTDGTSGIPFATSGIGTFSSTPNPGYPTVESGDITKSMTWTDYRQSMYYDADDNPQSTFVDSTYTLSESASYEASGGILYHVEFTNTIPGEDDCEEPVNKVCTPGNLNPTWSHVYSKFIDISQTTRHGGGSFSEEASYSSVLTTNGALELIGPDECSGSPAIDRIRDVLTTSSREVNMSAWGYTYSKTSSGEVHRYRDEVDHLHIESSGGFSVDNSFAIHRRDGISSDSDWQTPNIGITLFLDKITENFGYALGYCSIESHCPSNRTATVTRQVFLSETDNIDVSRERIVSSIKYGPAFWPNSMDGSLSRDQEQSGGSAGMFPVDIWLPGAIGSAGSEGLAWNPLTEEKERSRGTWF